ncbi:MAG: hypothetical protein ACKVX9_18435 [Blastocatellia bacterium]
MPRHKIDLTALRNRQFLGNGRILLTSEPLNGLDLSRRKFLGIAGFAAVGGVPFGIDADTTSSESFEIIEERDRVTFSLRGQARWVIDSKSFVGRPCLKVDKTESHVRIELDGAKYPGTDLPADLRCDLSRGNSGWVMRLNLSLCDFITEVPFIEWLAGVREARADFNSISQSCNLGSVAHIALSGRVAMKYCTDCSIHMSGRNIATISGLTGLNKVTSYATEIVADSAIISLPCEKILLNNPSKRRTLITIDRGEHVWSLTPSIEKMEGWAEGWKIEFGKKTFDVLQIETSESARGTIRHALLAEPSDHHDKCRFWPGTAGGNEPLTLNNLRFAAVFDSSGYQCALLAGIAEIPARFRAGDCHLLLSGRAGVEPFQLVFSNGKIDRLVFAPALLEATAPLPGVITRAVDLPENVYLDFSGHSTERSLRKEPSARVHFDQQAAQSWVELPISAIEIVRPEDLLVLRFEFVNLFLRTTVKKPNFIAGLFGADDKRETQLVRLDGRKPAYIIAQFPPQHIVERAFFQASEDAGCDVPGRDEQLCPSPVLSRISGPSRLVFRIPDETQTIPYTLDELLGWSKFKLNVAPTAQPLGETTDSKIQEPDKIETAIELPYRLTLSPNHLAGWAHSIKPIARLNSKNTSGKTIYESSNDAQRDKAKPGVNWIELWHTRLAVRGEPSEPGKPGTLDEENQYYRTIRAIWSPDVGLKSPPDLCTQPEIDPKDPCDKFRMAMEAADRYEIVHLTSNFTELQENKGSEENQTWVKLDPIPIKVKRLMLSSLGAWLDSNAGWPDARRKEDQTKIEVLSIRGWRHLATMGRDHYVKIVYGGYLYPFGHRASLIQITERKFQRKAPNSPITAYLRQRLYLKVEQETMKYGNAADMSVNRQMPFRSITIKTPETPDLDQPENNSIANQGKCTFWPQVCAKKFLFHLVKEDATGRISECDAPAIFVVYKNRFNDAVMRAVRSAYAQAEESNCDLNGQKIAFVASKEPGDTTYETRRIRFGGIVPFLNSTPPQDLAAKIAAAADACSLPFEPPLPPWNAVVEQATVKIPALEQILGSAKDVPINWDENYIQNGLDAANNAGEVFAKIADDKINLSLPDTRSVGVVKPDLNIQALSRRFGSVGEGFEALAKGEFNSDALLQQVQAKILGVFNLKDVIQSGLKFAAGDGRIVPKIATRMIFNNDGPPAAVESRMEWQPKLKEFGVAIAKFTPRDESGFSLQLVTQTNLKSGGATTYDLRGELRTFNVEIIQAIRIIFDRLDFVSSSGQKPNIDVSLANPPVVFLEALDFVQALQKRIPGMKGLKIEVNEGVVTASLAIAIPNITIGVFSLLNMRFAIQVHLPLKGDTPLSLRFSFGEPSDPFLVAVTFLGGGGYFVTKLSLHGIEFFMVGIEFGGVLSLDIAVASGKVYIFAGFRFVYEKDGPNKGVTLTGYLRCGGELDILGIISLSVEFFLGLSYRNSDGRIWGIARVTVSISILFFSKDIELTVEREFSGSRESSASPLNAAATSSLSAGEDQRAPTFEELMGHDEWHDYCGAFATGV